MSIRNPILTINGAKLQKSYYSIYILKVTHENDEKPLLYVGKTGDNNHVSARPVLRRMAGHLLDYASSDQNQLYRGIVVHLGMDIEELKEKEKQPRLKKKVEKYLANATIDVYSYKVRDFDHHITKEEHRQFVTKKLNIFEKQVISYF